jgi:hypothetical protein
MGSVDTVMVDGDILVAGGKCTRVEEADLFDEAQRCAEAAWRRFVDRYGDIKASREQLH